MMRNRIFLIRRQKNAPTYEIRAYHTNAVAKTEKDTINIADRTGLTDDKVEVEAPAGYRISSQASMDANWADTMSVTLTEGKKMRLLII